MSFRAKVLTSVAVVAVLIVSGLLLLNRAQPVTPKVTVSPASAPERVASESAAKSSAVPVASDVHPAASTAASQAPASSFALAQLVASAANPASDATPAAASIAPSTTPSGEAVATARMYAAHAPLRTPEVTDPDSAANKRILSTMVMKALNRSAAKPSANIVSQP